MTKEYNYGDFVIYNPMTENYDDDSVAMIVEQIGEKVIIDEYYRDRNNEFKSWRTETDIHHIFDAKIYTGRKHNYNVVF